MSLNSILFGISTAIAEGEAAVGEVAGDAAAAGEEAAAGGGIIGLVGSLLPLVLIFVVMYFLMIRPQKKKDKQVKAMLDALKPGDNIVTIGGIYGTIVRIKDEDITLSVGRDNLSMVVKRWAIRSVEEVKIENDAEELN